MREQVTTEDVLATALALLDDGRGWCQGVYAREGEGRPLNPELGRFSPWNHPDAAQWCLEGALKRAVSVRHAEPDVYVAAHQRIRMVLDAGGVIDTMVWNDEQENFGPVKAVLQAALEGGK